MSQRAILQYLSLTDWKLAHRLPIRAGEMMLSPEFKVIRRLVELGLKARR